MKPFLIAICFHETEKKDPFAVAALFSGVLFLSLFPFSLMFPTFLAPLQPLAPAVP